MGTPKPFWDSVTNWFESYENTNPCRDGPLFHHISSQRAVVTCAVELPWIVMVVSASLIFRKCAAAQNPANSQTIAQRVRSDKHRLPHFLHENKCRTRPCDKDQDSNATPVVTKLHALNL